MIGKATAWVVAAAATLAVAACGLVDDTPTYRYRLTVEVETPAGLRTGSSVIEVETDVASQLSIPTPGQVRTRVHGEAVAIDLPDGKTLFALLRSEENVNWPGYVMYELTPLARDENGDAFRGTFDQMLKTRRGVITLPRNWLLERNRSHVPPVSAYPMLVTFGDLADPASVEQVDPDNLVASFGEGVRLKRITVHMTDDAVTSGIRSRLRWLGDYPEPSLDPDRGSRDFSFSATLHQGDFVKR